MIQARSLNRNRYDVAYFTQKLGTGHTIIVRHDTSMVKTELYAFTGRITGLVVLISAFVTIVTMLVVGITVINPIQRLRDDLIFAGEVLGKDIENSKLYTLSFKHKDELGEVIDAFNQTFQRIHQEITARQKAEKAEKALQISEDELKAKTQQLESTLLELKRTQSQLIQTKKMSGLGQIIAGIAHKINNPVNFIHGNILPANQYFQELLYQIRIWQTSFPPSFSNPPVLTSSSLRSCVAPACLLPPASPSF